ncbi:hypothetical protein SAMN04488074_12484 [Lentzea albidocapillata subsp. violacea]|uniref:Uncharacterized protein n=1 Tax=Lentzea albidocapillata subsp. violacea TaxID=128104 RepID=A0A1G9UUB7_9PSEU|nr:hypothetical protein [Lentzea albidocapillata]SDM63185.1 hypothetical protein SAMN04488074_12484 [Lentzea albidocapillata subsp. violacea]
MSITTPHDDMADQPPRLAEILAVWTEKTPDVSAADDVVAAWFELKTELLRPITEDPDHPEHDQARHFAAKAAQTAISLRSKEDGR